MAVDPELQYTAQHKILDADIGVITNVRIDHVAEMGSRLSQVCDALSNTIPVGGKLFHDMVALHGKRQRVFGATGARDSISYVRRLKAWLAALPKPCGIMTANDFTAKSVLDLCTASGIRIPQDIAVVGVDNDENICLNVQPPLSSVLPDMESVGYEAMRLLDRIIRNPRMKPVCVEAGAALMVVRRESSRAHAAYRGDVEKAVALIRARACDGLRARDVVAAMQGSRRYAELAFRNATGHSILDEIQAVRMERARTLVHNSTYTVAAIANPPGMPEIKDAMEDAPVRLKMSFDAIVSSCLRDIPALTGPSSRIL